MNSPENESFPFEELDKIFAQARANTVISEATESEFAEVDKQAEDNVKRLLAESHPFFEETISRMDLIAKGMGQTVLAHDWVALTINLTDRPLPNKTREQLTAVYAVAILVNDISIAIDSGSTEIKQKLQLDVLESSLLPPDVKLAANTVIADNVPGETMDVTDHDKVMAMMHKAHQQRVEAVQEKVARDSISSLLDAQTEFLHAHAIHPDDPYWIRIKAVLSHTMSSNDPALLNQVQMRSGMVLGDALEGLGLTSSDLQQLINIVDENKP